MEKKYVTIETGELDEFIHRLGAVKNGQFRKELLIFLQGIGDEFLRIIEDEIIRTQTVDTRLLINSFQKGGEDNTYIIEEGSLTLEVGTNVTYASYVNDGHWTNKKGVAVRWVPGYWSGGKFTYDPGAKTGMALKQKWVEGYHYFDMAVKIMDRMLPELLERKTQQWVNKYFSEFL